MFRRFVLPRLAWWFYRAWSATWRVRVDEHPSFRAAALRGERLVFAHWHGQELCLLPLIARWKIATMTSTSHDGQLIDYVVRRAGGATSRGSSTRGGAGALRGLVRLLRAGHNASMAVDGPKGPLHRVKPGVFELARLGRARIVPTGAAASGAIVFQKSWNKALLPRPFSRVRVVFHEPWPASPGSPGPAATPADSTARLEADIAAACQLARAPLNLPGRPPERPGEGGA